jgi:putative DNA primase/helicase
MSKGPLPTQQAVHLIDIAPESHTLALPVMLATVPLHPDSVEASRVAMNEPQETSDTAFPPDFSSELGIAVALLGTYYPGGVFYVGGQFCTVVDGKTVVIDVEELKRSLCLLLDKRATKPLVNRVVGLCEMRHVVTEAERLPDPGYVYFSNGKYDLSTGTLVTGPSPRWVYGALPHAYTNQMVPPTQLLRFLNQIFDCDDDRNERIAFVQEWMGYLMVADTSQQKMLMMLGGGANGKSILCNVFEALVGASNVTHAMPDRLGSGAVRATLAGKLLNISTDLPDKELSDGYFKAIVGGDRLDVEQKYRDPRTVAQYCRLVVATNHLPATRDQTHGFFRRFVILTFNRRFDGTENGLHLERSIVAEMPLIIEWALAGLQRLITQGHFSIPPSSVERLAEYRADVDPVRAFAEECLRPTHGQGHWSARDLLVGYGAWCKANGHPKPNFLTFGKGLYRLGFTARKISTRHWDVALTSDAACYFPKPWNGPVEQPVASVLVGAPLSVEQMDPAEPTEVTLA